MKVVCGHVWSKSDGHEESMLNEVLTIKNYFLRFYYINKLNLNKKNFKLYLRCQKQFEKSYLIIIQY